MDLVLDPCLNKSNKELFKSISNVLVNINAEFCGADDIKVNSTITKIVAASSENGKDCLMKNWNHVRFILIHLIFIIIHYNLRNKIGSRLYITNTKGSSWRSWNICHWNDQRQQEAVQVSMKRNHLSLIKIYKLFVSSIANEAQQCFHKSLNRCDFKAPSEVSKIYFDFILNIFDCQSKKGYGLFIGILALIIMCSAAVLTVIHRRR